MGGLTLKMLFTVQFIWNCYRFSFKIMLQCSTRFILERGRDGIVFDEKMEDGHVISQNATHSP